MNKGPLRDKSYAFAIRIVKLSHLLQKDKSEFVLARQVLRSGTAVGALIREAELGESTADFIHKMSIALKEANETDFWLSLLKDTKLMEENLYISMATDCKELIAMLVSTIKTLKGKLKAKSEK